MGARLLEDFALRFRDLQYHLLRGFVDEIDLVASRALLVVLAAYLMLGIVGLFAPRTEAPRSRLRAAGVIIFGGVLLAYLGLPHHLRSYELMTFYPRFSVLLVLIGTLLVPGALLRFEGLGRVLLLVPAVLFGALYGRELIRHYRYYDKEVADFDAVLAKTPPGGKALGLVFDRSSRVMRIESAMVGMPYLYAALRPSPTAMVPIFYCGMRHMPCRRLDKGKILPDPGALGTGQPVARGGGGLLRLLLRAAAARRGRSSATRSSASSCWPRRARGWSTGANQCPPPPLRPRLRRLCPLRLRRLRLRRLPPRPRRFHLARPRAAANAFVAPPRRRRRQAPNPRPSAAQDSTSWICSCPVPSPRLRGEG